MEVHEPVSADIERVATVIVDAAIKVHRALGPGLLESVYERCLAHELSLRRLAVQRQLPVPIIYEGEKLEVGFRLDLLVDGVVIVECKAIKELTPIDRQQTLTHLRMSGKRLGLLINFNVLRVKDGIARIIN